MDNRQRLSTGGALLASAAMLLTACAQEPTDGPIRMEVRALGSGACTGSNENPFSTMTNGRVKVTGVDPVSQEFGLIFNETFSVSGSRLTVPNVPQGNGHKVEFIGTGGGSSWYGSAPSVNVKAEQDATVEILLTKVGACTQLPVVNPTTGADLTSFSNVRFPAVTELGDGRVMISGGFQSSDGVKLGSPSNKWFIVNPRTAELQTGTFDANFVGRAAHVAVFLPGTGEVLLTGGATEVDVVTDGSFPINWEGGGSTGLSDAALFTPPASGDLTGQGTWNVLSTGANQSLRVARAFARAAVTSDGLAVITGGGRWPLEANTDYQRAEVFDPSPSDGSGPKFLNVSSFDSFARRSGHSLTFIKNQDGLSYLLAFGGTPDNQIAEVMRQSSRQADGVDGNYVEVTIQGDTPPKLYFHEMTRLSGERFLLTGGVPHAVDKLPDVSQGYAYLLTYSDTDGQAPTLTSRNLSDQFSSGRIFHSALSGDFTNVAVLGGFGPGGVALETDKVVFFNVDDVAFSAAPDNATFLARAGQGGLAMQSGSMIIVGGEPNLGDVGTPCGHVEICTPSYVEN